MIEIPYCTAAEVRSAIDFPSSGAPINDTDIETFIEQSEEEIEGIYHTKFGNVEDSGTAESGTTTTLTDTDKSWTANDYEDYVVWVYEGTGEGQYRSISSNTTTALTVTPAFTTAPDNTSKYRIVNLGYKSQTVDGNGTDTLFVEYQPLINLISLTIDSISITTSYVYQYLPSGKLVLSTSAEETTFEDNYPQLVDLNYVYGVYPLPKIIKRLCICLAAMRALTAQIAGTYDDFTNISLPGGVSGSKGEPYTNIQSSLQKLQSEAKGIIYGDPGSQLGSGYNYSPAYRPFAMFG